MAEYDRLAPLFVLGVIGVLPSEHVDLALVDTQLTNVRLEEEDVGALHERIQYLRRGEIPL